MSIQKFVIQWRSRFIPILVAVSLLTAAIGASSSLLDGSLLGSDTGEHPSPALASDHQGSTGSG